MTPPTKLEHIDAAIHAVQTKLGRPLTASEEQRVSMDAETDYELYAMGTFLKLRKPEDYSLD